MCNLCNRLRPQARAFRDWTTTRFHQLRHHITRHFPPRHPREMLTRQPHLKVLSYALFRAVLVSL